MATHIVLISVDNIDARKVCELIQDMEFENMQALFKQLFDYDIMGEKMVFTLNDFMDEVNNQYLDVLTEYFISYVKIKN